MAFSDSEERIFNKILETVEEEMEAKHPNRVFSKEQIYTAVWKAPGDGGAVVPNVICQIRYKIGEGYIETVVGSGYKFIG